MDKRYICPSSYTFKQLFIKNSNAIDPQPGYDGDHKLCPLYKNHLEALEFMLDTSWVLTKDTPLDAHRILTKGIGYFEDRGMSGQYRNVDVYIGRESCPNPYIISNLMNSWFEITSSMIEKSSLNPVEIAWISHHMFEVIHPFIDGNGRTGRLLLNKIATQLGVEPIIVLFEDRFEYYDSIQHFKRRFYQDGEFINLQEFIKGA
jgi:Fic family protein